ncbi:MAG: Gfo/Idh/MocA family oxidoreductase, partial [Verrucomicrobia bacterium]|nr:Gfo/Idh/MocA family oxidoreductase [Verrucomicrobiota bacterium]
EWGVIGSGGIARRRTIPEGITQASNAELVAVFDPNAEANQAVACAKAGKHVLSEKPLGMTVADAEAMIAACRKAGVRFGTAFLMRFLAQHQAALALIRDGKLGKPVFGRAQLSCWYPPMPGAWRQDPATGGGGSLMDMGGHCIDLLEMFLGPVKAVSCFTNRTVHSYTSEDSALASLFFENGALGTVDTFFCMPDEASQNRLELYGSLGSILAKGTIGQGASGEMIAFLKQGASGYDAQQARGADGGVVIAPPPINTYRAEVEEFSQAILDNREPSNNAQIGLQSQRVLAACYESARTGKVVKLPTA